MIGPELAKVIVDRYLQSTFDGGNSTAKIERIAAYEGRGDVSKDEVK